MENEIEYKDFIIEDLQSKLKEKEKEIEGKKEKLKEAENRSTPHHLPPPPTA